MNKLLFNPVPGNVPGVSYFLLAVLLVWLLSGCQLTIVGTDGKAYYKVGKSDYVQYSALDSLDYSIMHYKIVKN